MPLFEYPELAITQIILLAISGIWMLRRNDEIPLLISFLLFYVTSYRYWAVESGINKWIDLSSYGLNPITLESATRALGYIVFGQICLLLTYMWRQRHIIPLAVNIGFNPFLEKLRPKVILFGLFCLPLVFLARSNVVAQYSEGRSLAFQISGYLQLFPLVLIGLATLILCLWKFGGMRSFRDKVLSILILVAVSNLSFNIGGRFQFLGWLATAGIIISSSYKPKTRLILLALSAVVGVSVFAVAGAMRAAALGDPLYQAAWERFLSAEDANMLDGFALLQDAFPRIVPFRWGMAHLEVLIRPIPRAIWLEKPAGGGYLEAVGLVDPNTGNTLGFSPTFFGDFYSEAGLFGIFIFSIIYGAVLATIVRRSVMLQPFASVLIRAIVCAALVPLLRGGDIPGIYAWIFMAFWPCFLLLWLKRKSFRLLPLFSTFIDYPQTPLPSDNEQI